MIKSWTDDAWEDYTYWQTQDRKTLKRINNLLKDIERNGYDGIGKPESCWMTFQDIGAVELTNKTELFIA